VSKTEIKKHAKGVTLIEAMILLFIFSIITMAFYSLLSVGTRYIVEVKNRLGAAAVANEKMEIVRNLDYSDIGTTAGIPSGNIPEKEVVTENSRRYYIFAFVQYVDDPFDSTAGGSPKDAIPNDYKRVRIKVAWEDDINSARSVSLVSTFPPKGIETNAGGGVLAINILNSKGIGIPQAKVHIKNAYSGIDITTLTDDTGNIMLPSAPVGTRRYVIEVSKDGYLSVVTMPPYNQTPYNPVDVHASVVKNTVNVKAIVTDKLSSFALHFKDAFGVSVPSVSFDMVGGRILGNDLSSPSKPVYVYSGTGMSSDSDGEKDFTDMSYGTFYLTIKSPGYTLIKVDPGISNSNNAFGASPGNDSDLDVVLADNSIASAFITIKSIKDSSLIPNATVELKNSSGYDATISTDAYGQAYFPTSMPALTPGSYAVSVSASGFKPVNSQSITIGGAIVIKEIKLTPGS